MDILMVLVRRMVVTTSQINDTAMIMAIAADTVVCCVALYIPFRLLIHLSVWQTTY